MAFPAIELSPGWQEYRVAIPGGLVKRHLNVIDLEAAWARAPAEVTGSDDLRVLSLRVDRIDLIRGAF